MSKSLRWLIGKYFKETNLRRSQIILKTSLVPKKIYLQNIKFKSKILDFCCGEGITSNLLGTLREDIKIDSIDKNKKLINDAKKINLKNVNFFCQDVLKDNFFENSLYSSYDLIICNDIIHHFKYKYQRYIIENLIKKLNTNGKIIIKEVDKDDFFDFRLTKFFDEKLYKDDFLSFRRLNDWKKLLNRIGYKNEKINISKQKHIWPASRSTIILEKIEINDALKVEKEIQSKNYKSKKKGLKNIVITGVSGFIGKNLIESLKNNENFHLILISRSIEKTKNDNISFFFSELSELKENSVIFDNVDFVIHLASEVKYEKGDNIYENNINGTKYLLRAIGKRNKENIKKIIFFSSIGAIDRDKNDQCEKPLNILSKPHPSSSYGYSKLVGERLIRKFTNKNIILRICWCYGKYMTPDTHMKFLFNSTKKNKFYSFFNFPAKISLIHVEDLLRIIKYFLENDKISKTYFVHNGQSISLGQIFKSYKDFHRKKIHLNIPNFIVSFSKKFCMFLPFKIKTLLMDTMLADNLLFKENPEIKLNKKFPDDIGSLEID